jgi:ACS family glucarate transporter-like MFS transporter
VSLAGSASVAFVLFLAIRAWMGVLSAPLHPASARAISLDIPVNSRSGANGLVTGAALLGVASTFLVFGALIRQFNWPGAFLVAAGVTAALGGLWWIYGPRELVPGDLPVAKTEQALPPAPFDVGTFLVRNKNLILLTLSYAAVGYFQYLFFYWMHFYFVEVLKLGANESAWYASSPPLAMAVCMPLGGRLCDWLETQWGRRIARSGLCFSAMTASAVLLWLGVQTTEPAWIVTWMSLALGVLGFAEGPFWVTAVEVGGKRGGLSAAVFNTGGTAGGILSPLVTPWVSDELGYGWGVGITVGSVICLLGAACWIGIDSSAESPS